MRTLFSGIGVLALGLALAFWVGAAAGMVMLGYRFVVVASASTGAQ